MSFKNRILLSIQRKSIIKGFSKQEYVIRNFTTINTGKIKNPNNFSIDSTVIKTPQVKDPHTDPRPQKRNELDPKPKPRKPKPASDDPFPNGKKKQKPSDFPIPDELYPQPI